MLKIRFGATVAIPIDQTTTLLLFVKRTSPDAFGILAQRLSLK